jgi:MFS family permease
VLLEIREGVAIIARDPIIRAFTLASMAMATLWGVFGAIWILFAIEELGLGAAAIGIIAGFGGLSSLVGATVAERVTRRMGVGPAAIASMLVATAGFVLIPLAPASMPVLAFGFLVGQQLFGDGAVTIYDIAEVSVRQARVRDRALGRVAATVQVGSVGAQLVAALGAGLLAEVIGLRATAFLAPLGTLVAAGILVASPVRRLRDLPALDGRSPTEVVVDVERDQPVGA